MRHLVDVSSRKPAVPGVEGHDPEWLARTIRRRKATHLPSPRSPTDLNKLRRAFSFGCLIQPARYSTPWANRVFKDIPSHRVGRSTFPRLIQVAAATTSPPQDRIASMVDPSE